MHQNTFLCCYGDCVTTNQQTKIIKSCWRDLPLYHATLFSKNLYLMPAIFLFFSANNSFYKIMKNAFFFSSKNLCSSPRNSNFCVSYFSSFPACQSLLKKTMVKKINLKVHEVMNQPNKNLKTYYLMFYLMILFDVT